MFPYVVVRSLRCPLPFVKRLRLSFFEPRVVFIYVGTELPGTIVQPGTAVTAVCEPR